MQSRVLVTIVAWLVAHSSPVMATAYDYCSLKQVPVEKLAKNPETGEFVKTGDAAIPRALRGQRTSSSSDSLEEEPTVMLQAIGVTRRNTQEKNTTGWLEFGVRQCVCSDNVVIEDVYCPIKSSHCGIPLYGKFEGMRPLHTYLSPILNNNARSQRNRQCTDLCYNFQYGVLLQICPPWYPCIIGAHGLRAGVDGTWERCLSLLRFLLLT